MKFSQNAQAALQQPDTKAVTIEMTPERKEQFRKIGHEVMSLIISRTGGPVEAYMLLQFILNGLEESYGIRGGIIVENSDGQQ